MMLQLCERIEIPPKPEKPRKKRVKVRYIITILFLLLLTLFILIHYMIHQPPKTKQNIIVTSENGEIEFEEKPLTGEYALCPFCGEVLP